MICYSVEYKKPGTGMTAKLRVNARDEKHVFSRQRYSKTKT